MAAAIGFQHLSSTNNDQRNRMLPSEEEGVILVLHQGQRNSALRRQEFIKHFWRF